MGALRMEARTPVKKRFVALDMGEGEGTKEKRSGVSVVVGGVRIDLESGFCEDVLRQVLRCVRGNAC